jgi:type IV secretory pathway TraG/TraD family ATPase VirD4
MTFVRGVYRGRDSHGDITGGEEKSTLVLGPTRSGKTSSFIIPNLLLTTSPSVTTSTKTDVVTLMARARQDGATMLFDPLGTVSTPRGVLRVGYSPVRQAQTWDGSVLVTRT